MKVHSVSARYAPAIAEAIAKVVADAKWHEAQERRQPTADVEYERLTTKLCETIVPEALIDRDRQGDLVIVIGDLPGDAKVLAFPLNRHLKAAS